MLPLIDKTIADPGNSDSPLLTSRLVELEATEDLFLYQGLGS